MARGAVFGSVLVAACSSGTGSSAATADGAPVTVDAPAPAAARDGDVGTPADAPAGTVALWRWLPTSSVDALSPRMDHFAAWTGSEMIVLGGMPCCGLGPCAPSGPAMGAYDPVADAWQALPDPPIAAYGPATLWTGSELVVIPGGRFRPSEGEWRPISSDGAPRTSDIGVYFEGIVWTGSEVVTWGAGANRRYDPAADVWSAIAAAGAPATTPASPIPPTTIWSGSEMVVWCNGNCAPGGGARYDPAADTWTPMATDPYRGPAVWTGSEMIVWGWDANGDAGGRYDPVADSWTRMSTADAPAARAERSTIWTGNEMLVWGGRRRFDDARVAGGRYDPARDAWSPMATDDAPAGVYAHSSVWTGSEMIIWGGEDDRAICEADAGPAPTNAGARYAPPVRN